MFSFLKSWIFGALSKIYAIFQRYSPFISAKRFTEISGMELSGNSELNDNLMERLAESIVATKMETIAIGYLKIQSEAVTNLRIAHQGNPTAFNRAVLSVWKCMNPVTDQVQVCLTFFKKNLLKNFKLFLFNVIVPLS